MTELYLYQIAHVAHGRARCVADHIALLDTASHALFGRAFRPDLRQFTARIEATAAAQRPPQEFSSFVRFELTASGEERFSATELSLYDGYALRSVTPDACTLRYDLPLSSAPTSAREAVALLAHQQAQLQGCGVAVRRDSTGILRAADEAPLFALSRHTLLSAPDFDYAERSVVEQAARTLRLELREEPFGVEELRHFDELFALDHRGITALLHCDQYAFMSFTAEHLATAMEAVFSKK